MSRRRLLVAAAVLLSAVTWSGRGADAAQLEIFAPASYMPGTAFDVEVHLLDAVGLNAFNVEVQITSPVGAYGTDFSYALPLADPTSNPAYVFGAAGLGLQGAEFPTNSGTLMLSDLLVDPQGAVNTSSGSTLIERITILPAVGFVGPLTISIPNENLLLLDVNAGPITGFLELSATLPAVQVTPAPEPASLGLLLAALPCVLRRRGRTPGRPVV